MACGAGNSERDRSWVLLVSSRIGGKCWVRSLRGMEGCVARSLGEIRGPIPIDFGGVLVSVCREGKRAKKNSFSVSGAGGILGSLWLGITHKRGRGSGMLQVCSFSSSPSRYRSDLPFFLILQDCGN